jgi:hypothetical protein
MKSNGSVIKHSILALGVCASLAAGSLGFGGSAEARVPEGDRVSREAEVCGGLQDNFDMFNSNSKDPNRSISERIDSALKANDMRELYKAYGCEGWYGPIEALRPVSVRPGVVKDPQNMPVLSAQDAGPAANVSGGVTAN